MYAHVSLSAMYNAKADTQVVNAVISLVSVSFAERVCWEGNCRDFYLFICLLGAGHIFAQ